MCVQFNFDTALFVSLCFDGFAIRTKTILDRFVLQGRSVVVFQVDRSDDLFAAEVDRFIQIDFDLHGFQFVFSDLEPGFKRQPVASAIVGVATSGRVAMKVDAIVTLRRRFGQHNVAVDRAEVV